MSAARRLQTVRTERVCFDFAVINGLGQEHWTETTTAGGSAAGTYEEQKKRRGDTERKCQEAGLQYRHVIHEAQSGTSKRADAAMRGIADAVAAKEHKASKNVLAEMAARIAVLLARCNALAIRQRRGRALQQQCPWVVAAQLRLGPAEDV